MKVSPNSKKTRMHSGNYSVVALGLSEIWQQNDNHIWDMAECDKRNLLRDYRLVAATDVSALQAESITIFLNIIKLRLYTTIYCISLLQVSQFLCMHLCDKSCHKLITFKDEIDRISIQAIKKNNQSFQKVFSYLTVANWHLPLGGGVRSSVPPRWTVLEAGVGRGSICIEWVDTEVCGMYLACQHLLSCTRWIHHNDLCYMQNNKHYSKIF